MNAQRLMPRKTVPPLAVETVDGRRWSLSDAKPEHFSMVVFYRGLHCPICKGYLADLDKRLDDFAARGVEAIALSTDAAERAAKAKADWGLEHLRVGYGLSLDEARAWGLYVSRSRGKTSAGIEEPPLFSEPGLFLVRPDGTLYWGQVSTMPFARPRFEEILTAVDFVLKNDYPARGEA